MCLLFVFVVVLSQHLILSHSFHVPKPVPRVRRRRNVLLLNSISMISDVTFVPLSDKLLDKLTPRTVTTEQIVNYWGLNSNDKLQRVLESLVLSYGGAWAAWFVSFLAEAGA